MSLQARLTTVVLKTDNNTAHRGKDRWRFRHAVIGINHNRQLLAYYHKLTS